VYKALLSTTGSKQSLTSMERILTSKKYQTTQLNKQPCCNHSV